MSGVPARGTSDSTRGGPVVSLQGVCIIGSLLFALLAAAPLLLQAGFLNTRGGGDSPFLLFRLHELYAALHEGIFPVRWMPHAAFGLGYPFFSYYAALPYYFAAGFRAAGFSYVLSLKLVQLLGFLLAAWGMFAWVRRITNDPYAALLASAAYSLAPFHMVNVYVRGDSLSEFWAMAWFPLILLALHEAARKPDARRIALLGLAFAALVLTHNVSTLIFSPFVAVYALGCAAFQKGGGHALPLYRRIALLAAGGLLALALAAWVWLPYLAETGFVQLGEQTTGYFFYGNHFRAGDLVQRGFLFDYDTGHETSSPFSMGLAQAILAVAGTLALIFRMLRERAWWRDGFLLGGLALSTLMITPLSDPVWAHVPFLPLAQFPWRFLSIQALFCAAAMGALITFVPQHSFGTSLKPAPALVSLGLGVLLAVAALGSLRPDFILLTDSDITPQRLQWYESFSGNIGTTIRYEYLPVWATPRPYASDVLLGRDAHAKFLVGLGSARRVEAGAASQTWAFDVESESARVALPLLYWPGWRATVDGLRVELTPLEGLGYVQLEVPQGEHIVRLWLGRTPIRLASEIASLVALIVALAVWRPRLPRWRWGGWALVGGVIVSVALLALLLHGTPERGSEGLLSADFAQQAYFHPNPDGILFTDGLRLLSVMPSIQGSVFQAALTWDTGDPGPVSVGLAPPPQQGWQGAPIYPVGTPLSAITPGLYFVRLQRPDAQALTTNGHPRGDLYLAPLVIPALARQAGGSFPLDEAFGPFRLRSAGVQADPGSLHITLWWEALQEATRHEATALRLYDVAGNEWAALDTQAGSAGMYPTGLWQPGEIVPDNYRLTLPEGTPPGLYTLRVTLYDAATLKPTGQAEIGGVAYDRLSHVPCEGLTKLSGEIGLARIDLPQQVAGSDPLIVRVDWVACDRPRQDYQVRWTLRRGGAPLVQVQTPLAPGSDPLTWQPEPGGGVLVLGRHRLGLPHDLPLGDYALTLQLLSEAGDPLGQPYEAGSITYEGQARSFEVPPLDTPYVVSFGGQIKLWGYTLIQDDDKLSLEVAWAALTNPASDYKIFLHLFDPNSEQILAQLDTMPRGYAYPTSRWVAGEVVTETLTLDLTGVPPGRYRIALGWYDPASGDRLEALAEALNDGGVLLPDGRVTLQEIIIP